MARRTRTIRRIQTSKVGDFDDQLWPINCVILILAGLLSGIVIATSDFHDPRILYNGWARLVSVAVMMGLLFWGVLWLQGKMLRRLQFCLLASLLAHFGLAVYFYAKHLEIEAQWETRLRAQEVAVTKIPDYHFQSLGEPRTRQSFEKPIETEVPGPAALEAVQREADEPEIAVEQPPAGEPETPKPRRPEPATGRRAEVSAPRRADAAAGAQISRQQLRQLPTPNEPIPEPEITAQPGQTAAVPDATAAPRRRPETEPRVDQRQSLVESPAEQAEQVEIRAGRRASQRERVADAPTAPTPTRQASPLAGIPPIAAATPEPVRPARRPPPIASRPADRTIARQRAAVPRVVRPITEPAAVTALAGANLPFQPAPSELARDTTLAMQSPTQPSPRPRASRPARMARPEDALLVATAQIDRPAAAEATSPARPGPPIARPTTTAVSTAADESPGLPPAELGGGGLPTIADTSGLPSPIAARRATASQQQSAGPDTAPTIPSSPARFSQGGSLPSTAIPLEGRPAARPAAAGGTPASRLAVVGETAALRSANQPSLGTGTAASGTADFALGSTDVVARGGQPRSAGSGRPSPAGGAGIGRIARAGRSAGPAAAPGIAEAAPTAPAGIASQQSGPAVPSLSIQGTATRRGGTVRPYAAQSAVGAGPVGSSGTSGPVGVAQSSRVTRHESIASATAGGGTPRPARTAGGDITLGAVAEAVHPATAAPSGGTTTQRAPWPGELSGPHRRTSGLSTGVEGEPTAGALASLTTEGTPVSRAVARRATGPPQGPGGPETGSARTLTMTRTGAGTDLPAAAVPIENLPTVGTGGLAASQGGLPSALEAGPTATVRQAAADLPVGQATTAAGTSESGLGAGEVVVMAGHWRANGDRLPASAAGGVTRAIGRTAVAGPAIATPGAIQSEPLAEGPAGGPPAGQGALAEAAAAAQPATGLRGSGRLPSAGQAEALGAVAPPDGQAVAVSGTSRSGPDDTATAAGRHRSAQGPGRRSPGSAELTGPLPTTDIAGLRPTAEKTEHPPAGAAAAATSGSTIDAPATAAVGPPGRRDGGLPVQIAARAGPGGLGYLPLPDVGIPSRRARPESEIVHPTLRRFVVERSGGQLAIDGRVRQPPAEAFRQRDPGRRAEIAQALGGSESTERAVELGLDYFAQLQFPDGHWSLHELPEGIDRPEPALGQMEADSAATGLALLAYLGAGYTHLDGKHRAAVGRGIDWLVRHQKPDGDLFSGGSKYTRFYSHGIASIALCEAYGMTRDPELREPVRKAIEFIINTQHPTRGGWRYDVHPDTGRSTEADTSVSGWMLMALKSAQMAGLEVPDDVLQKVDAWLETAAAKTAGQYIYNPYADPNKPEQLAGLEPNLAMSSEAMLMRMYLGYGRDDPGLIAGAEHLKDNLPQVGTRTEPLRDCYYWYYATQAMFQMRGDYWDAWNDRLRTLLTSSQVQSGPQAGSWHPMSPVPDRWGHAGGRLYVTALHILMLEVYYRHPHLPLFRELIQ